MALVENAHGVGADAPTRSGGAAAGTFVSDGGIGGKAAFGAKGDARARSASDEHDLRSFRTVSIFASVGAALVVLGVTVAVLMAFGRMVDLAEKSAKDVVPQVLHQQEQAVMAADLGRVAEMILGSRNREDRALALDEAETIAHRFAQVTEVDVLSKLDSALHAVRRSAYQVDVLDTLDATIRQHLQRIDALLPPLGGDQDQVNSYSTQLLFEVRHLLYAAGSAQNEDQLQKLQLHMETLVHEMQRVARDGQISDTGGRVFSVAQIRQFGVVFDLRSEYLKVREQVKAETHTARQLLANLSSSLSADAAANVSQSAWTIVDVGWNGITIAAVAAGVALVAMLLLILALVRYVVSPVLRIHSAVEAIRGGEPVVQVPHASLREFEVLGRSVQQLAGALSQIKMNEQVALQSQQQLQFIFDVSPVPFVMSHLESGDVISANDAACGLFKIDETAIIGRKMRDFWVYPRRRQEMIAFLAREGFVDAFEAQLVTTQGQTFWVMVSARKVTLSGKPVQLSAFYDVTEQRAYERRLQALVADLEASNQDLEQFASVASHDLKEPLRVVSSYIQLLKSRHSEQMDEEAQEFLAFAQDAARRMQQVIFDLLDYARVGRNRPPPRQVSIEDVIHAARFALSAQEQECGGEVIVLTSLPRLMGDEGELVRLFQNLIGNALKYHHPDRPPRVEISATSVQGAWEFAVADNGIGIAPEYTEKVFEIFHRLHSTAGVTGTGIGLAICRKIVQKHGGRLWVDTAGGCGPDNEGCTFRMSLPAA